LVGVRAELAVSVNSNLILIQFFKLFLGIRQKTYSFGNLPLPVRQAGSPLFALRARLRPGRAHAPEGGPMGRRPKRGISYKYL